MIKCNNIVTPAKRNKGDPCPYGRVSRFIDHDHVEVIDCGRFITVYHIDDLEVITNYTGYWRHIVDSKGYEYAIHVRMPSLRKLKQMAACYDRTVWKKVRKNKKLHTEIILKRGW